jgi:hypothetical protein
MRWVWPGAAATTIGIGIAVVLARGGAKDEPARASRPEVKYLPLAGGDTFDQIPTTSCLVPTLDELRKHPNWMVRIDQRSSFAGNIDAPPSLDAVIELEAKGAQWHDGWRTDAKTAIEPAAVAAVTRALTASCAEDSGAPHVGTDIVWFEIAYGPGGDASVHLPETSAVAAALVPIFDAARKLHVSSRIKRARTVVLRLKGRQFVKNKGWRPWALTVDVSKPEITDEDAVTLLDWALAQPETMELGEMVVSGTLVVEGTSRPIAVALDASEREQMGWVAHGLRPLWELYGVNRFQ